MFTQLFNTEKKKISESPKNKIVSPKNAVNFQALNILVCNHSTVFVSRSTIRYSKRKSRD